MKTFIAVKINPMSQMLTNKHGDWFTEQVSFLIEGLSDGKLSEIKVGNSIIYAIDYGFRIYEENNKDVTTWCTTSMVRCYLQKGINKAQAVFVKEI
jgi:hypothetical protein